MRYCEDEFLNISGIQHFSFCRRQWALIHIEQQWEESYHTVDGEIFHENAHDCYFSQKKGEKIVSKGVAVKSYELGISGVCDIIEFIPDNNGISLSDREGKYFVCPVEYKRGEPKEDDCDALQLTAQALCLEEMLCCKIEYGYLFYGKTRHRLKVYFDCDLRKATFSAICEMHDYYSRRYTPKVRKSKKCGLCSLSNICMPKICSASPVRDYIREQIDRGECE